MEERQYTQQEVLEMLQNPEKAAQFREQCKRKNSIFAKEDSETIQAPDVNTKQTISNYYKDYIFESNGCLMPLDNNGFDGISNDEFMREMNKVESFASTEEADSHPFFNNHTILTVRGKIIEPPKLNKEEREILEITAQPGFMDMLREEFRRNPIDYEQAQQELEMGILNEAQVQITTLNQQAQW